MAGSSNIERQDSFIAEVTVGTTPATPAFTKSSFNTWQMRADPRISESFPSAAQGQRGGISRSGQAVSGNATGPLLYGEYDPLWESLFQGTWTSNVLVNAYTQTTFTVEQSIPQGAGGALQYTRFKGVEPSTGRIILTAGEDASVEMDFIGSASEDATATAITGATYVAPTNTNNLGSGADIGTITMSGFTLDCMRSCTIDFGVVDKEEQPKLSSDDACGVSRGVMRPVITGEFYIEDEFVDIYNAARDGTDFALVIPIGSVTGEKYSFNFPSCEFVLAPLEVGESGPAFQSFTIHPKYDTGISGTCELTRAIA